MDRLTQLGNHPLDDRQPAVPYWTNSPLIQPWNHPIEDIQPAVPNWMNSPLIQPWNHPIEDVQPAVPNWMNHPMIDDAHPSLWTEQLDEIQPLEEPNWMNSLSTGTPYWMESFSAELENRPLPRRVSNWVEPAPPAWMISTFSADMPTDSVLAQDVVPQVPHWMNSLSTKLMSQPILYGGLVEDLKHLANVHSSAGPWRQKKKKKKNHVRELVLDIEDWVDQKKPATMGQLEITEQVEIFKAQIEQMLQLYASYEQLPSIPDIPVDGSDFPSCEKRRGLIALEEPTLHLEQHLLGTGEMMLKVVSIYGMEGSGKTSLAKEIYAKLQWQFDCKAFVSVGRRASVRTTLHKILGQVKPRYTNDTSQDLHKLRTELWEYLGDKRYFIVLDGLWSKRAWELINCALPDKNCGSRVLTTTCITDVAEYCSMHSVEDLHAMKPLSEDDSKILLQRSVRVANNQIFNVIHEFSAQILKICEYMPLAIIVAAGIVTRISQGVVNEKMNPGSMLGSLEQSSTSQGMTKMLDMSYAGLCLPLKSCFLYLSVFPEEHTIMKDRLIWLWRAEGFITSWDTGVRYFNELIIMGLIEPVFSYDDDAAVGCTVQGVIRDYIRSLSREENFVTVGADLGSGIFPCSSDTVRRLSLDCYNDRGEAHVLASSTTHLLSMRSLAVFGDTEERDGRWALTVSDGRPVLPCFKLVRVLDLEDADDLRSHHLKGVEGLTLLKYLGLRGTGIDELPGDIGKMEHLEVLDVRQTKMSRLPASIARLKRLMRLLLDGEVKVPCNIFEMEGLEEVSTIGADSVISFCSGPDTLPRRLRVLGVSLAGFHPDSNQHIIVPIFLGKLMGWDDLLSISLFNLEPSFLHALSGNNDASMHQTLPRKLEATISGPILSGDVCIIDDRLEVTHLHMEVTQLTEKAVYTLARFPKLVLLKLVSAGKDVPSIFSFRRLTRSRPGRCIISRTAFLCLEVLCFTCKAGGIELQFGPGAMPELRRLGLCFSAWETLSRYGDFEFGIQHLKGLTRVHATISCEGATVSEVEQAEGAIREQARQAGCTTIQLQRELEDKMMLAGERKSMGLLAKTAKRFTSLLE